MYDDYEPVADRLAKWWAEQPAGRISTSYVFDGTAWVFCAELYREGEVEPAATGYARQELLSEPPPGRNGPNTNAPEWTSPVEVCETSAIGRALANLGYAAKKDSAGSPSREEMTTQKRNPPNDLARHINKTKKAFLELTNHDQDAAMELWGLHATDQTSIEAVDQALTDARMDWGQRQNRKRSPSEAPF